MISRKHSTKDYITISLYYLMSKFDYESISVTDICSKARVSRMSFYRYFNNNFFQIINEKHIDDIYTFLLEVFNYMKKYARQVTILKRARKENLLVEKFTDYGAYLASHMSLTTENNIINNRIVAAFLAGGIANVLLLWFELGLDLPPQEMAKMAYSIFSTLNVEHAMHKDK